MYLCAISAISKSSVEYFLRKRFSKVCIKSVLKWHHHLNKLQLDIPKDFLCAISKNSVEQFWRRKFCKVCITFAMFKLFLAINFPIM